MQIKYLLMIALFPASAVAIVGGHLPAANDPIASRTAALFRELTNGQFSTCTVALLDEGFAITAAHCMAKLASGEIWFVNSYSDLQKNQEGQNYTLRRRVLSWRTPDEYTKNPGPANDIAVLQFEGDLPENVLTFAMPKKDFKAASTFFVAGFGSQSQLERPDGLLRIAHLPSSALINPAKAGYFSFDQAHVGGACAGDSGGPLAVEDSGNLVLLGIVGGGLGVDRFGKPLELKDACLGVSVFPNVFHHREWIRSTMEQMVKVGSKVGQ